MLFRPVRENDLDDIVRLAARAGVGMTSLPHDVGRLAARIRRSIETFAGELPRSQQGFLFVLEDTALARVVGPLAVPGSLVGLAVRAARVELQCSYLVLTIL